jgi:predicted ribosomally synthesized peptide with SipW-like signal peptide
MKKIMGLTIAALLIMGMVAGGTWAYFSDTETSSANTITAGTLDLTIGGDNVNYDILTLTNRVPGDSGQAYAELKNVGSVAGELDIGKSTANQLVVTNTQGTGGTEYELSGSGELGAQATMALWIDVNENSTWDAGTDIGLKNDGTTYTSGSLDYQTFDSYDAKYWGGSAGITNLNPDDDVYFFISWQIPTSADNTIQGDTVTVGLTFILEQSAAD